MLTIKGFVNGALSRTQERKLEIICAGAGALVGGFLALNHLSNAVTASCASFFELEAPNIYTPLAICTAGQFSLFTVTGACVGYKLAAKCSREATKYLYTIIKKD